MSVVSFGFSADRKQFHSTLLARVKPRLEPKSITAFLFECEREISWCLSGYPEGLSPAPGDTALLKKISEAAYELQSALRQLDRSSMFALSARMLAEPDRGIDVSTAKEYASDLVLFIGQLRDQAMDLKNGPGTPISVRVSEELACCIAKVYVHFFETLPSLRHDGIYKQFLDEITNNDLPELFRLSIGKRQMDLANRRAILFTLNAP